MARGAIVKHEDAESGPAGEPKASKRRCVQSACVPCRKRKSKVGNPDRLPAWSVVPFPGRPLRGGRRHDGCVETWTLGLGLGLGTGTGTGTRR